MNDEQGATSDLQDLMVGKRYIVYTPTNLPYKGTLIRILEKELLFEGRDKKLKLVPRGMYDMEEERR